MRKIVTDTRFSELDLYVWLLFSIWLIIDSLNGFSASLGKQLPISLSFKFLVLILIIWRLSSIRKYFIYVILTFGYLSILLILHGILNNSFFLTLNHLSKPISTIFIYLYLVYTIKFLQEKTITKIQNVFFIGFIVIAINLILGIFHIGNRTYQNEGVGYKGFFYAGNEVGGVFCCIIPFILYLCYWNYSKKIYFCLSTFILSISIILATKSVLIISLASIIVVPWIYGNRRLRKKIILFGIPTFVIGIIFYLKNLLSSEAGLIVKYAHTYNTKGLLGLILSDRDQFWQSKSILFESSPFFKRFWGLGENLTVEIDPLDGLLNYGYLGFLLIIIIYIFIIITAYRNKSNNSYMRLLIFQDWLLITMSILAGHIVFSSMAGLYVALINSLAFIKKDKKECLIQLKKF